MAGALIEIRKLTKLYRMGDSIVRALDGVDLQIERGEFLAITGASGSGKSTMMHLLGCLDRPTEGSYVLNGRRVSEMSDRELAYVRNTQIGFVFQTFNLINRTSAADNVGVPLFYARRGDLRGPSMRALERVGLKSRAHHKPNELSGGERQRVAIARAIVNDPPLLLADEPTGNLDTRTGEQIMAIFHDLNAQGVTIVIVTHEPDIAAQTRRIVQMRDGRIVSDRPVAPAGPSGAPVAAEAGPGAAAIGHERDEIAAATTGPESGGTAVLEAAKPRVTALIVPQAAPAPSESNGTAAAHAGTVESVATAPAPPRRMGGATATLVLGILSLFFLASNVVCSQLFARMVHVDPEELKKGHYPKDPLAIVLGLSSCISIAVAPVLAVTAMVIGVVSRRAGKRSVVAVSGYGRVWSGIACGGLTLLLIAATVAFSIVAALKKAA